MNYAFATRSRPAVFASLLAATMLLAPAASAQSFSDDQKQAIEGIIKDYLLKHPEVVQDAMTALEKKQQDADAEKARTTIKDNNATLFNSPHQVVLGNPQGSVTVVEFFDYNCGYCKRALPDMLTLLKTDFEHQIRAQGVSGPGRRFRRSRSRRSRGPACRTRPARNTSTFHQKLLSGRGPADKAHALAAAKDTGFDMARIEKDMNSDEVKTTIDEDMKLADALGVSGTPSYVVGSELIVGAVELDALKEKLAAAQK